MTTTNNPECDEAAATAETLFPCDQVYDDISGRYLCKGLRHHRDCRAFYRPAVAQALRDAYGQALEDVVRRFEAADQYAIEHDLPRTYTTEEIVNNIRGYQHLKS